MDKKLLGRYQNALRRIGSPALLQLPEGIRKLLRETTDLETKTELLEEIADARGEIK